MTSSPNPLGAEFRDRYGPRALVLGGSEGIGLAFAETLAASGFDLTLVARSAPALERAADLLGGQYGVEVQIEMLDLTASGVEEKAQAIVGADEFGLVVYNAGAAHGVGLFLHQPAERAQAMVALNCTGPLAFAHPALTAMRERKRGGFIVVSSMSGVVGSGYVAAYAAAKSFEIVLAEGLHWELARDGVDVMCAVATLTDTPAMRRSGMVEVEGMVAMAPDALAQGALRALGSKPVWYAVGDTAVEATRAAPRTAVTAQASVMSAQLWGINVEPAP